MNFISRMLDKGAGSMTDVDIYRKVDGMGGSLAGFSGNDSFGLYGSFFQPLLGPGSGIALSVVYGPDVPSRQSGQGAHIWFLTASKPSGIRQRS